MKFNAVATIVMDLRADARAKDASLKIVIKGLRAKIKEQRSKIKALTIRLDQGRGQLTYLGSLLFRTLTGAQPCPLETGRL